MGICTSKTVDDIYESNTSIELEPLSTMGIINRVDIKHDIWLKQIRDNRRSIYWIYKNG